MSNPITDRAGTIRGSLFIIALSAILLAGSVWAQESGPAEPTADKLPAERAERQARLDKLMDTMAVEMGAIRDASDRKERDALMAIHREHMHEAMRLMRDMGGTHMREVMAGHMGPGRKSPADSDQPHHLHKRIAPAARTELSDAERLADLEIRLDMMQVMMESMMEHHGEARDGGS